jgi:metal-sulfur cluster biosynthetic enzyme
MGENNNFLYELFSNINIEENNIKFDITPKKIDCEEYRKLLKNLMNKEIRSQAKKLGFVDLIDFLEKEVVIAITNINNGCDIKQEIFDFLSFDEDYLNRINKARISLGINPISLSRGIK